MSLPKYSEWHKLWEAYQISEGLRDLPKTTSGGMNKKDMLAFCDKFPYDHIGTKDPNGHFHNPKGRSTAEIIQDLSDFYETEITDFVEISPGSSSVNIKPGSYLSSKHIAIEFSVDGKWQFIIPRNPNPGSKQTSTHFKEILACYFVKTKNHDIVTKENWSERIDFIINELKSNISGLFVDPTQLQAELSFLDNNSEDYNVGIRDAINNALSAGASIASKYSNWNVHRDNFFDEVKSAGSSASGLHPDKWCPMDIMLVRPGSNGEIKKAINASMSASETIEKLGLINNIFEKDWGAQKLPIVGISLKEQKAQGGKAKGALPQSGTEIDQYNITNQEVGQWKKDPSVTVQMVDQYRQEIHKLVSSSKDLFSSDKRNGKFELWADRKDAESKKALDKYGASKMALYLMNKAKSENIFLRLVQYGMSLGSNPAFFKVIGDKKGGNAYIDNFPPEGGVNFYEPREPIEVYEVSSYAGIDFSYKVVFKGDVYQVVCACRANSKSSVQVTLELKKLDKI